jgi:5,10-methylenetetrahydrofolate reductase
MRKEKSKTRSQGIPWETFFSKVTIPEQSVAAAQRQTSNISDHRHRRQIITFIGLTASQEEKVELPSELEKAFPINM